MKKIVVLLSVIGLVLSMSLPAYCAAHRIGGGLFYWALVGDLEVEGVKEDGITLVGSYQYQTIDFIKFEAALEVSKKGFENDEQQVIAPIVYFLLGRALYGGVGAGMNYADGEFGDPFFAARAGLDLELLPNVFADLNATYRFEQWGPELLENNEAEADLLTLGVTLRLELGE